MPNFTKAATERCVHVLNEIKDHFAEKSIYPNAILIIDQLVDRQLELEGAFQELHDQLSLREGALWSFFDLAPMSAIYLNEERSAEARKTRDELKRLNKKIADAALVLSGLLEKRDNLQEGSGFWSDTIFHIVDLIDDASQYNTHYSTWLREPLHQLRGQFDLKYWSTLPELVGAIADDFESAQVDPDTPLIEALTKRQRPSRADFYRALLELIDQNRGCQAPHFPKDFHLTDASLAALGTCLLGLGADASIDAEYVKRFRQREKQ